MGAILSLCFHPPESKPHLHQSQHYQQHPITTNTGQPAGPPQSYANFPSLVFHPAPDPPIPTSEQEIPPGVKNVISLAYCYKIPDGDTLNVNVKEPDGTKGSYRVRVRGIDCPESDMRFGHESRMFTAKHCLKKNVSLHVWEKDQYGRLVADVITDRGVNLGFELVKQGLAWWYRPYDSRTDFRNLEDVARKARKGLWSDKNPIPPWDHRKSKKKNNINSTR